MWHKIFVGSNLYNFCNLQKYVPLKKITANIFPKICYTDHLKVEDSGIDKDDASTDNEITSNRSSGQSVSAYAVVIE